MFENFPNDAREALTWDWEQYEPYAQNLIERDITEENIEKWLKDYTRLLELGGEVGSRLYVAHSVDTTDEEAEKQYLYFVEHIASRFQQVNNTLNIKLLQSGIIPEGMEVPLREVRAAVEIFREENIPLTVQLSQLSTEYDKIAGAQTVEWEGEERTIAQMQTVQQENDRSKREKAFRLVMERQLQDREALNELWVKLFKIRQEIAKNAGFDNYMEYRWQEMGRFDYTPEDARRFNQAIEKAAVPAAKRLYEKRRERLGYETLRPWDLAVDSTGKQALRPFQTAQQLKTGTENIFNRVDPELGSYFQTMREEDLLDLENRKGKAPGGYCTSFNMEKRPFIFMNAVGVHDDVQTMLHEAGHSFHVFESAHLPYAHQHEVPMEFAEVASMAMELLAAPYLTEDKGGFYDEEEAARARVEHLEGSVQFWPYMAVVDSFQQWAYTSGDAALDPANCDAKWAELWARYMQGVDSSGLEDWVKTGWHRKLHIFHLPFYYIEYGLAQLGAVQVWSNSLKNHAEALKQYRQALALGGTVKLPELYAAAGAKLAFDADTLGSAVELMERTVNELDPA